MSHNLTNNNNNNNNNNNTTMATSLYSTPATSSRVAVGTPFVPILADSYSLDQHKMIDCENENESSSAALFLPSMKYPPHRKRALLKPRPTFTCNTVVPHTPLISTNHQQVNHHRLVERHHKVIPHRPLSPTCCSSSNNLIMNKPKALPLQNRRAFKLQMRRHHLVLLDKDQQDNVYNEFPRVHESSNGMMMMTTPSSSPSSSSSSTPRLPSLFLSPGYSPLYLPFLEDN